MSCQETSSPGGNGYQYSHDETATIRIYPSSNPRQSPAVASSVNDETPPSAPWSLYSRVSIESTSTLQSSTPIFHHDEHSADSWNISEGAMSNGTPFSKHVLELLSRYPLQRLLIRVGDAAASSGGGMSESADEQQLLQEDRARGPSGTSIQASFIKSSKSGGNDNNNHEDTKVHYQNQYASILRYLLDNSLFPPCGAPLDSLRVRKHGHSVIVRSSSPKFDEGTVSSATQTINVESFLAADAATFCNPGIQSLLLSNGEDGGGGWGSAANNGACHSSDNWGLFDSVFGSSSGITLSELLLGASPDATPWNHVGDGGSDKRNSVWVDMQVDPSCFSTSEAPTEENQCSIKVTRGASYRVGLPKSTETNDPRNEQENQRQLQTLTLSLGDLLLGHDTLEHALMTEEEGWKAWYPCPLSDSSRILMQLPTGYIATLEDGVNTINSDDHGENRVGRLEFNVLSWKDGHIDLAAPWAKLYRVDQEDRHLQTLPSAPYGISRTVQRPLGISGRGTLVSVLRYDQVVAGASQSQVVNVQSLDVLPGTLIKPRMHTLRMMLYQGGGAGGNRFVPPSGGSLCDCVYNKSSTSNGQNVFTEQCGSICSAPISLSELEDHKLILHPDGTILLERNVHLQPDSSLWMMLDFDEAYLPFQKFPADANRGVDAFPSRATFTPMPMEPTTVSKIPSATLYSPSLLLLPPVPDMSMPFNVISLSCTLWAFVLGSLLNILVRRGTESVKRELTGEKEKRLKDKIKEKIKEKIGRLKAKIARLKKPRGEAASQPTQPKEKE